MAYYYILISAFLPKCLSFVRESCITSRYAARCFKTRQYNSWFENLFFSSQSVTSGVGPAKNLDEDTRVTKFPEQYAATYEPLTVSVSSDGRDAKTVRPLLKQTQLERRKLQVVYSAQQHGWDAKTFHRRVDGRGASIVLATGKKLERNARPIIFGGYNPKGWASLGGARPSIAAFLFYSTDGGKTFQKLRKVGGGGLACARDDPNFGIAFGPDSLILSLEPGKERVATSKLGNYYERGPERLSSLFGNDGGSLQLDSLKVLVGVYNNNEDIPYSGAVLDMTSG
jgi:hypothetical protein